MSLNDPGCPAFSRNQQELSGRLAALHFVMGAGGVGQRAGTAAFALKVDIKVVIVVARKPTFPGEPR